MPYPAFTDQGIAKHLDISISQYFLKFIKNIFALICLIYIMKHSSGRTFLTGYLLLVEISNEVISSAGAPSRSIWATGSGSKEARAKKGEKK